MQAVEPRIHKGIYDVLGVENSVRSRTSFGGTSPARVAEQVEVSIKYEGYIDRQQGLHCDRCGCQG